MRGTTLRATVVTLAVMLSLGLVVAACGGDSKSDGGGGATTTTAGGGGGGGGGGDAKVGEAEFQKSCSSCHGKDAKGLPNLGKDLVASTFLRGLTDKEAIAFITKGRPTSDPANTTGVAMPPKGGNPALKEADLANIVAYLRTLEK